MEGENFGISDEQGNSLEREFKILELRSGAGMEDFINSLNEAKKSGYDIEEWMKRLTVFLRTTLENEIALLKKNGINDTNTFKIAELIDLAKENNIDVADLELKRSSVFQALGQGFREEN